MQSVNIKNAGHDARLFITGPNGVRLALTLADGRVRETVYTFGGQGANAEELFTAGFTEKVGNLVACLGGTKLTVYPGDNALARRILQNADGLIRSEKGCARAIRVADRINAALGLAPFAVEVTDTPEPAAEQAPEKAPGALAVNLRAGAEACRHGIRLGIDVGGTDIKAVAFKDGRLAAVKEYDWAPAEYGTPEEITGPILLIAGLLVAAARAFPAIPEALTKALEKNASLSEMRAALESAPAAGCASIGLSYPDVVIRDRIVGGETPKTKGMQLHDPAHYEDSLRKIAALKDALSALLIPGGTLHMANDGNIAAYTAAAELSFCEDAALIDRGVFAHSLGTDLGTGILLGSGTFPEAPLELYTFRTGREEEAALALPPEDVRSARTVHSGLRGAERRVGQAAAFRYAYALAPRLLEGYIEEADGVIRVITAPEDKRKALLEHLMACADAGDRDAEEVFVRIGRALADITVEAEALLKTGTDSRYLFGRFVKRDHVFRLIERGFEERCPGIRLVAADSALTKSPLMCALAAAGTVTVAQFGQAVGAVYYGA